MALDVLQPFVTAATEVLAAEAGVALHPRGPARTTVPRTRRAVTVCVPVAGAVAGVLACGYTLRAARRLASALLGEPVGVFGADAESALGEVGNVIAGRAACALEAQGLPTSISPPTVLKGRGQALASRATSVLTVGFDCALGRLELGLALESEPTPNRVRRRGV